MLLTLIIIIQNNEFLIIFLKYFNQRNFNIKDAENIEVLLSISIYILTYLGVRTHFVR